MRMGRNGISAGVALRHGESDRPDIDMTPPAGRPLILGHRGASAGAGDNTVEAFELAVAAGADGVELDVRFTADRAVVLHHDPDVPEMGPLIHHDLAMLRRTHPEIPTLDEALQVLGDLIIDVEIKNATFEPDFDPTHDMARVIARWVAVNDLYERVVVTSFNPETVGEVHAADPGIVTGRLIEPGYDVAAGMAAVAAAGHGWIAPFVQDVIADAGTIVAAARACGLRIAVWTVDDPGDIATLAMEGVDAIVSNDPAAALRIVRRVAS
jgi:glycerophosphoryl diester phosphodiesterase